MLTVAEFTALVRAAPVGEPLTIGSLFSGGGGLDMAVEAAFGGRTVWHSELDPAASKVLEHRWPGVPNLGDITAIDWATVKPVDIACGGFPCQDVSPAGRQAGLTEGTRSGLWAVFAAAIAALRPPIVVVENVRGLLSAKAYRSVESENPAVGDGSDGPVLRAAGAVLGDLADLGYDAQWTTVAASSVGAPHKRERVFILATNAARDGRHEGRTEPAGQLGRPDAAIGGDGPVDLLPTPAASRSGRNQSASPGAAIRPSLDMITDLLPTPTTQDAHNNGGPSQHNRNTLPLNAAVTLLPTPSAADGMGGHVSRSGARSNELLLPGVVRDLLPTPAAADGQRGQDFARAGRDGSGGDDLVTLVVKATRGTAWGKYEPAIRRWEQVTRPAPSPTEPNTKGNPRLAPAFSEWMLGWLAGWVTELVALGLISRNDALRIIGNGVCPQQASAALTFLLSVCGVAA